MTTITQTQPVQSNLKAATWVCGWLAAMLTMLVAGERITLVKALAIVFGLAGVLVIVRPNSAGVDTGQLLMLAAALGFAIQAVLTKSLTRTDSAVTIIFRMLIIQSVLGALPAAWVWTTPSAATWPWLVLVAFCGAYSHCCFAQAMRYADATVVVPMDFLRVPLSALVGWLAYNEVVDRFTAIGMVLILFGNLLNLRKSR